MGYKSIDLAIEKGCARITLNQPDTGNTITEVFCRELLDAANELTNHDNLRVVLLNAKGKYFSFGGDIKAFAGKLDSLPEHILKTVSDVHVAMARLIRLDAPIIASVQGVAMGGAVSMISNCDLVISAKSAKFGAAYHQLSFPCDLGGSYGLVSRMGMARAKRFLLLGEMLDAEQAEKVGLVDEVVDDADLSQATEKMVEKLGQGPTVAYGMVRQLIAKSLMQPFDAQLEDEAQAMFKVSKTMDVHEGVTAFLEKRSPVFKGK